MTAKIQGGMVAVRRGWWAVYTKHQHEKRVADMLLCKGTEVFLPLYRAHRRRRDRTVSLTLPLFPSYVFVRQAPHMRLAVLSTPGVHLIVSNGPSFGVIPDEEIENLRVALAAERAIEPHTFCRTGSRVRITRGALQGLEGILVRQKGFCRVILSIEMLAKSVAVEVDVAEIGPAHGTEPRADGLASATSRICPDPARNNGPAIVVRSEWAY
jgi:transcription antitermination factor NusG